MKYVYVLMCYELQDNGDERPVLYGTYSTRELAEEAGAKFKSENDYIVDCDITETIIDE